MPTTITLMKAITSAKHITWVITPAHIIQILPKLNRQYYQPRHNISLTYDITSDIMEKKNGILENIF